MFIHVAGLATCGRRCEVVVNKQKRSRNWGFWRCVPTRVCLWSVWRVFCTHWSCGKTTARQTILHSFPAVEVALLWVFQCAFSSNAPEDSPSGINSGINKKDVGICFAYSVTRALALPLRKNKQRQSAHAWVIYKHTTKNFVQICRTAINAQYSLWVTINHTTQTLLLQSSLSKLNLLDSDYRD